MPINTKAPTAFTNVLIGDTETGSATTLTNDLSGNPVSASLELQSTEGALLLSRMSTTQLASLNKVAGMLAYDTTLGQFVGSSATSFSAISPSVLKATISITSAQLLSLHLTPVTVVAAQSGAIYVHSAFFEYLYGTTAYTLGAGGNFQLTIGTQNQCAALAAAGLIDQTSNHVGSVVAVANASVADTVINNLPLKVGNTSATEWTLGDGTVTITVFYSVISINAS